MPTSRLLLIDDDARLFELLDEYLGANDIALSHAADGPRGLALLASGSFDALLLDVMMPGIDGLEVLRRVRSKSPIPIIMLTAKGDVTDKIVGLELGADEYIAKPFNPRELLARIRAVLRRSGSELRGETLVVGPIEIDLESRSVLARGNAVQLTALEFDILVALARRRGRVVTRQALLSAAGRDDVYVGDRAVNVHISHIRRKLADDGDDRLIKTVRGVGYVMAGK